MDFKLYYTTLTAISPYSYMVPLIFIVAAWKRQPVEFKWLAASLLLSSFTDLFSQLLFKQKINPNYAVNLYQFVNPVIVSFFFYSLTKWNFIKNLAIGFTTFAWVVAIIGLYTFGLAGHLGYSMTVDSLIIILFSILYFYKLLKELPNIQLQKNPMFWIVSALFFSYAGKLVLFAVSRYLINVFSDNLYLVWTILNTLSLIGNLVITASCYSQFRTQQVLSTNRS